MTEGAEHFMDVYGWHIIQLLTLLLAGIVQRSFKHLLDELKGLRSETKQLSDEVKAEHDRFKEYVRESNCVAHREQIERHIRESEERIAKALAKCSKRKEDKANG